MVERERSSSMNVGEKPFFLEKKRPKKGGRTLQSVMRNHLVSSSFFDIFP